MANWESYLGCLAATETGEPKKVMEAGIVGMDGVVWTGEGSLKKITVDEVKKLVNPNRSLILSGGVTIGGVPCTVVNDRFMDDGTIALKTKKPEPTSPSYFICIEKSKTALVMVKGLDGVHGGQLTKNVMNVASYLSGENL
ncbi:profilin-2-like [Polymixia lowei]